MKLNPLSHNVRQSSHMSDGYVNDGVDDGSGSSEVLALLVAVLSVRKKQSIPRGIAVRVRVLVRAAVRACTYALVQAEFASSLAKYSGLLVQR
jgi:hypothetical protein